MEQQLELPLRTRWPLSEFADGAGRNIVLPSTVQEIAEFIGRGNAVRLAETAPRTGARQCRRMYYVPQKMPQGHRIVQIIGKNAADRLAYSHGNCILELPSCYALRRAYLYTVAQTFNDQGLRAKAIAAEMKLSVITVERLLSEAEYWRSKLDLQTTARGVVRVNANKQAIRN